MPKQSAQRLYVCVSPFDLTLDARASTLIFAPVSEKFRFAALRRPIEAKPDVIERRPIGRRATLRRLNLRRPLQTAVRQL